MREDVSRYTCDLCGRRGEAPHARLPVDWVTVPHQDGPVQDLKNHRHVCGTCVGKIRHPQPKENQ